MTNHDDLCEKDKEIEELRTRVAELELCNENANALIADQADESQRIVDKLQNRLSTLEKSLKDEIAERDRLFDLADKHRCRVFDLLKASEGMEKALEECHEVLKDRYFVSDGEDEYNDNRVISADEIATQALADFRALKEMK